MHPEGALDLRVGLTIRPEEEVSGYVARPRIVLAPDDHHHAHGASAQRLQGRSHGRGRRRRQR